jgi:predicted dehydrogenase
MIRFWKKKSAATRTPVWSVPEESGELRVAMVGAGKMGRLHCEVLQSIEGVRCVAICTRTAASSERFARDFSIERSFQDVGLMLEDTAPDAVVIAVSHAETVRASERALERGVPCLIEKPAGLCSGDTRALADLADRKKTLNMVGVNRRYIGSIQRALLQLLQFGPLRGLHVVANEPIARLRRERARDEAVLDQRMISNGIHYIDLMRCLGGDVASVRGFGRRVHEPNGEHFAVALEFESGAIGTFSAHWSSPSGIWLRLYGDGVTLEFPQLGPGGWLVLDDGTRASLASDRWDRRFKPGLYGQMAAFLQAVCDREPAPPPASDLRDHRKSIELAERILQTAS